MTAEVHFPMVSEVELNEDKSLTKLYRLLHPEIPDDQVLTYMAFAETDHAFDMGAKFCFNRLELVADKLLPIYQAAMQSDEPIDANMRAVTFGQAMEAWAFVFPPLNGGKGVSISGSSLVFSEAGIKFGVLDDELIRITTKGVYMKAIMVAKGISATQGDDGFVNDYFSRTAGQVNLVEAADGSVDFKDLHWIINIEEGQQICGIVPPLKGTAGRNVKGEVVPPLEGKPADIPMGKNTSITEDGTHLVADVAGHLVFDGSKFNVEKNLVINGSIGNRTGNINLNGNLRIMGDVPKGYEVKATGNITINGAVQSSVVKAGGNIIIDNGITGEGVARVEAGGYIKCNYIEDCNIYAKKHIMASSIVNSNVRSESTIHVKTGAGVVKGGTLSAQDSIEINTAGNENGIHTKIELALPPGLMDRFTELEGIIPEYEKKKVRILKQREVTAKRIALAKQNGERPEAIMMIIRTAQEKEEYSPEELDAKIADAKESIDMYQDVVDAYRKAFVKIRYAYAGTTVAISGFKRSMKNDMERCIFREGLYRVKCDRYNEEDEIVEIDEEAADDVLETKDWIDEVDD